MHQEHGAQCVRHGISVHLRWMSDAGPTGFSSLSDGDLKRRTKRNDPESYRMFWIG